MVSKQLFIGVPFLAFVIAPVTVLADIVYENESGGSAKFYGQLNPSYLSFDDGSETTGVVSDNANSNSRVGFWLDQPFGENLLRFNFETGLGFRQSSAVSQTFTPLGWDWNQTDIRKIDLSYDASFGTVYGGQGSMATDGVAEYDLSGTTLVAYSSISDTAGSFLFRDADGTLSGIDVGDVFNNLDGSRRMRVRYDTPTFSGFTGSAAYGIDVLNAGNEDEYYDIALKYANELGDVKIQAGIGAAWTATPDDGTSEQYMGSASLLHIHTGLNATIAGGSQGDGGGSYLYGKLGYLAELLSVGTTAISADYYSGSNFLTSGSESDTWGLGLVQKFDAQNLEVYAGYRKYTLSDDSDADYQDGQSVLMGGRFKF